MPEFAQLLACFTRIERHLEQLAGAAKPLLTVEEAAAFLGISLAALYKMTSQRLIPHFKPAGRRLYFERVDLEDWMRRNPVRTAEGIRRAAQASDRRR